MRRGFNVLIQEGPRVYVYDDRGTYGKYVKSKNGLALGKRARVGSLRSAPE